MILNTIQQFNWIDCLVIIIIFRVCYIALKNGLFVEFFKTLGTFSAIYLSLHYYTILSNFAKGRLNITVMPLEFLDFLLFCVLAILTYFLFVCLREAFVRFVKMETIPQINKWGGLVLGLARAFFLTGLIIFMLVISSITYFKKSVNESYLGRRLFKIAPATYSRMWNGFFSKFMTQEKFNDTVLEIQSLDPAQN